MELDANVYIVGAHALGTNKATSTVMNLPKPPAGERTASKRPPTLGEVRVRDFKAILLAILRRF